MKKAARGCRIKKLFPTKQCTAGRGSRQGKSIWHRPYCSRHTYAVRLLPGGGFCVKGFRRTRVVFVCLGNSCRSPMAEGIAAHIASDVMEVSSAGVAALGRVQSLTKLT